MKSFFCSLGIFALMLALIACNAHYVRSTTAEMERQLLAMSAPDEAKMEAFFHYWQNHRSKLSLTVPSPEIQTADERITELKWAVTFDEKEFLRCRALAICAVTALRRLEQWHGL